MSTFCPQALWITVFAANVVLWPLAAHAETWVMPAGGNSVPLGERGIVCRDRTDLRGWQIEENGTKLRPPAKAQVEAVPIKVAPSASACANSNTWVRAVAVGSWPAVDTSSVVLNVDAGRVDVKGRGLRGAVLRWQSGAAAGSDLCRDPSETAGVETCAFTVGRELPADPSATTLVFYPAGVPGDGPLVLFDSDGRLRPMEALGVGIGRVVVLSLLALDEALDVDVDVGRLQIKHPEAVGSVDCSDAMCDLDNGAVLVRAEHGADEMLDLRLRLRPHVYFQTSTGLDVTPAFSVPLQRCPMSLVSAAPLRGVPNQLIVVRLGGRCQKDASLRYSVTGSPARLLSTTVESDSLYAVLQVDRLAGDDVSVTIMRGGGVVGIAREHTRPLPSVRARIELPGIGPIDFIPTNRDATLSLPRMAEGGYWVPLPVEGVYTVAHEAGTDVIRGLDAASGWVALRLAYRDKNLPPALRNLNLAEISDSIDRPVKPANIPITLGNSNDSLAELWCDNAVEVSVQQKPGRVNQIPYAARDSCRLVLHRERLNPQEGEQVLRVTASVSAVDGLPRAEAAVDQIVRLSPSDKERRVYLGGVMAPFDRVVVRVAVQSDDPRYAVNSETKLGAPPLQWSLIMGQSHVRFYATTAFPTGLFRVADAGHSGILGLNGGVLFRFVALDAEGHQSPLGLETGVMWMGIAGDTTPSTYGQIAVVAGLGIGVPIANMARVSQASISLHAWAEFEVSRAVLHEKGSPWGFVFGPSLSVGDVGMNF